MCENRAISVDSIESFCRDSAPMLMKSGRSLLDADQVKSLCYDPDTATIAGQVQQLHGPMKYYVFVHLFEGKLGTGHCVCKGGAAVCCHMVALLLSASSKVLSLDKPYEWVAPSQNSSRNTNSMDPNSVITLKIIIVGESGVGKSSMLFGFVNKTYTLQENLKITIGIDYRTVDVVRNGKTLRLNVFDTAGSEVYRAVTPSYYRNAHGAIVVYDVSDRKSFMRIQTWINDVNRYSFNDNLVTMVVGNKIDKSGREVSKEEGFLHAGRIGALFVETSVKTREGIEAAFDGLLDEILLNMNRSKTPPEQLHRLAITAITSGENQTLQTFRKCCWIPF